MDNEKPVKIPVCPICKSKMWQECWYNEDNMNEGKDYWCYWKCKCNQYIKNIDKFKKFGINYSIQ